MQNRRHDRVRELLKRELSAIILREFPVSAAGLISVNDVQVANDLHAALVFVGIVGTPEQQKKGFGLLQQHRNRLRSLVGAAVVLKYTPELRFALDEAVVRGNRILGIIDEIEKATPSQEPADHSEAPSETDP